MPRQSRKKRKAQEPIPVPTADGGNMPAQSGQVVRAQPPKVITDLPPEMLQKIQTVCSIELRLLSRAANRVWNMIVLKSFEAEKELALQFGTENSEIANEHAYPYMDVQAHDAAQLQETRGSVFDRQLPNMLIVSKRVQERKACEVAKMFPNVETLHLWSENPFTETFRFIIALCRLMGPKLTTLNVWIMKLDRTLVVNDNSLLEQFYDLLYTWQLPNLQNLTLYIGIEYPHESLTIDLPILRQLKKCALHTHWPKVHELLPTILEHAQHNEQLNCFAVTLVHADILHFRDMSADFTNKITHIDNSMGLSGSAYSLEFISTRFTNLRVLELNMSYNSVRFDALVRHLVPLTALRQLKINIESTYMWLDAQFGQPIPSLNSVIHLQLYLECYLDTTHQLLGHQLPLAAIFPNLQALNLSPGRLRRAEWGLDWDNISKKSICFTALLDPISRRLAFPHLRILEFLFCQQVYQNV